MKRAALIPLLCLAAAASASQRIGTLPASGAEVYRVNAVIGLVSAIEFPSPVLHYASGFTDAWMFAHRGNVLFLKPKRKLATTNLEVVTEDGLYSFDLLLTGGPASATYRLKLEKRPGAEETEKAETEKKVARLLSEKREPEILNSRYSVNFGTDPASFGLRPSAVTDDGCFTTITFPAGREFPAVYEVRSGAESLLSPHADSEGRLVIRGVYPALRLRNGNAVAGIFNEGYPGSAKCGRTGTRVPGLVRTKKGDEK